MAYFLFLSVQTWPDLATFFLLAFGLFAFLGKNRVKPGLQTADYLALGLFAAALCLSTVFSDDAGVSLRYLGYAAINAVVLLLAATQQRDWQWRALASGLVLIGVVHLVVLVIYGGVPGSIDPQVIIDTQPLIALRVPNDALIVGLCLPAVVFVLFRTGGPRGNHSTLLLLLYVAASLYCSYLLNSKVVLLSVIGGGLALALVRWKALPGKRAVFWLVLTVSAAVGLIVLAWALGNQSTTRLGIWSEAVARADTVKAVLVGSGPNTFEYDPLLAEHTFDKEARTVPWAHNLFLEAFTEQGLLGLAAILVLTLIPIKRALVMADSDRRLFLLASALIFFLLALVELTLTRRFNFAYLCLLYGLSCVGDRKAQGH